MNRVRMLTVVATCPCGAQTTVAVADERHADLKRTLSRANATWIA